MNTFKSIENLGRQAWLAGLGAYGTGWKFAVEKFDETYLKGNNLVSKGTELVNELVSEGEKLQQELQSKLKAKEILDNKIIALKNKLGLNELSDVERVEQLTAKVDILTATVTKLVESKPVSKPAVKATSKVVAKAKSTVKKTMAKATKVTDKAAATAKDTIKKITK